MNYHNNEKQIELLRNIQTSINEIKDELQKLNLKLENRQKHKRMKVSTFVDDFGHHIDRLVESTLNSVVDKLEDVEIKVSKEKIPYRRKKRWRYGTVPQKDKTIKEEDNRNSDKTEND